LAPRLEKGYHQIWEANLQPKNAQSWARGFLALTPSVKWA
jgi:outer membrane cobalamin receptor